MTMIKVFLSVKNRLKKFCLYQLSLRKWMILIRHPLEYQKRKRMAKCFSKTSFSESLEQIKEKGYVTASSLVDTELRDKLDAVYLEKAKELSYYINTVDIGRSKTYMREMLVGEDFYSDSVFVKFALQNSIIEIVSSYFGQIPYLARIELVLTVGQCHQQWSHSQLWHKDYNDKKMIKFFIYLTDVETDEDGPFTFFPRNISEKLNLPLFPVHKSDSIFVKKQIMHQFKKMKGPRLTTFFIDTYHCYHMGSRLPHGKYRVAFVATYTTFASHLAYDNKIKISNSASSLERLILETIT
ncbi:hypothetical protein EB822_05365 [Flavobacteriaceae bacterium PRS1]|nr:hypothetical protein EB822_05365 [Flavobacteriaceae bacterium PRS1]